MKQLKKTAAKLDDYGRNGDTLVAHINPREAALLQALGGSGTVNPKTGLLEFWDPSDPGDDGGPSPSLNDGGKDEGDRARAAAAAAAPGAGPFSPGFDPTYSEQALAAQYQPRTPVRQFVDWVRDIPNMAVDKVKDIVANPFSSAINFATSFTPIGGLNTLSGFIGGPTVGGALTEAARSMTGYGSTQGATMAAMKDDAPADPTKGDPDKNDRGGNNADAAGSVSPFGSANSPLAKALLGAPTGAQNWLGNRMTYGPLASSYSPYGREYVTPWAYRG